MGFHQGRAYAQDLRDQVLEDNGSQCEMAVRAWATHIDASVRCWQLAAIRVRQATNDGAAVALAAKPAQIIWT